MSGGGAFGQAERGVFPSVRKQLGVSGTCWARATTVISACSGFGPSTRSEAASPPEPPPACPPGRWPPPSPVGDAPSRLAELRHLPQELAQAAKLTRLRRLRLPAVLGRRLVQPAQRPRRDRARRTRQNLLRTATLPPAAAPPRRRSSATNSDGIAAHSEACIQNRVFFNKISELDETIQSLWCCTAGPNGPVLLQMSTWRRQSRRGSGSMDGRWQR